MSFSGLLGLLRQTLSEGYSGAVELSDAWACLGLLGPQFELKSKCSGPQGPQARAEEANVRVCKLCAQARRRAFPRL